MDKYSKYCKSGLKNCTEVRLIFLILHIAPEYRKDNERESINQSIQASMKLSTFIRNNIEAILQEWEQFANSIQPTPGDMDKEALRDHAKLMLEDIADDLDKQDGKHEQAEKSKGHNLDAATSAALDHGLERMHSGFEINGMISEYRFMRATVIRLWHKLLPDEALDSYELIRYNEAIDQLIYEAVGSFSAECDRQKRLFDMVLSSDHGYILDLDGRFVYANQPMLQSLSISLDELVGRSHYDLHFSSATEIQNNVKRVVQNTEKISGEVMYCFPSEEVKYFEYVFTPVMDNEKQVEFVAATKRDITERKRAKEELRQRENQLQRIFEILPIGLWFADRDGTLLRGNAKGIEIWGADPAVPLSDYDVLKAWRLPSREPIEAGQWALAKTICNGETIVDELLEIETFDGKRKTILNYTAPVLDGDGRVDGAIIVNLDISDRKALEDRLLQAQKMESIGRLAGEVAHDFNNMLGVILGHTEMALEQIDPGQPHFNDLQEVRKAAERSAYLTRQLLTFARKQTIAPRIIDLNETVGGMLKMLCRLIGEDIDLAWLPGKKLAPVKVDPSQIDQVLANLCINSRDAIDDVGKITVQ
jgi:PAS domain S-box-containing protein